MHLKTTKQRYLYSLISLVLSIAMLLGTTYAWFTDSVKSGNSRIMAGNLDVEMYWTDDLEAGDWHNVEDPDYDIVFGEDELWEPGYTSLRYIKIKNAGSLAFKYKLGVKSAGAIGDLADALNVYFMYNVTENIDSRAVLGGEDNTFPKVGTLKEVLDYSSSMNMQMEGYLLPKGSDSLVSGGMSDVGEAVVAVAIKMNESAGNEYQGTDIGEGFYITATATQLTYEEDSFDSSYDEDIQYPEFNPGETVTKAANLDSDNVNKTETVLNNGTDIMATVPVGVKMKNGVDTFEFTVTENKKDANFNEETGILSKSYDVHVEGVASDNTTPIIVTLKNAIPYGMNTTSFTLYHKEGLTKKKMTLKSSVAEVVNHNDYYPSPDGTLTMALASFSEILTEVDTNNRWAHGCDTSWYSDDKTEFTLTTVDQLAGLAKLVNNGNTFEGKTIKLGENMVINNINAHEIALDSSSVYYDSSSESNGGNSGDKPYYFTPIGTRANPFKGTFDGNNHYVSGLFRIMYGENGGYDEYNYGGDSEDTMIGLFGCVYNGTVKNLTVKNSYVSSFGGVVGLVSAYATGSATFDNITVKDNEIETYNNYLGGVVGNYYYIDKLTGNSVGTITCKNISVDNTNKFGALWGTYDLPCGGVIGGIDNDGSKATLTNCNISCAMSLYNDCCANYQWFAYRYSGMLVGYLGSTDSNFVKSIITCSNCTVTYGEWTNLYYCELMSRGKGSYNGPLDYKYARLDKQYVKTVQQNGILLENETDGMGECTDPTHHHDDYKDSNNVLIENNRAVLLAFNQLFGAGQGNYGLEAFEGVTVRTDDVSIEKVFENTDKYLYRVGNKNAVTLKYLFRQKDNTLPVASSAVNIRAEKVSGIAGVEYTPNAEDWTQGTLQFSGTGVVKLVVEYVNPQYVNAATETVTLDLEVVDAKNITSYSEWEWDKNLVLLCDITMSNGGNTFMYATTYGNGFTFDVTRGITVHPTQHNVSGNCVLGLFGGTLDNIVIKGAVYTEYGVQTTDEYNNCCVLIKKDSKIINSYISNCAAPIRIHEGSLWLENSTLAGGTFANMDIRAGHVTLKDVTTINQSDLNDNPNVFGLGITVYYEGVAADTKVDILGTLKQYNWISNKQSLENSDADSFRQAMFTSSNAQYQYTDGNGTKWVNTGIISMSAGTVGASDIIDHRTDTDGYVGKSASFGSRSGYVYAKAASAPETIADYQPTTYSDIAPTYSVNNSVNAKEVSGNDWCKYQDGAIDISMDAGDTFDFNPMIVSVSKNNAQLPYVVTMNGTDYTNNTIPFDTEGNYVLTYRYTDGNNYDFNLNTHSVTYTKEIPVTVHVVAATAKHAEFTFGSGTTATYVTVGDKTYVQPATSSSTVTVGGVTVNAQSVNVTISSSSSNISTYSSGNGYILAPVFKDVVSITDYADSGNGSAYTLATNALPANLQLLGDKCCDSSSNTCYFDFKTSTHSHNQAVISNQLYFVNAAGAGASRDAYAYDVTYCYTDNAGAQYYYIVHYSFPTFTYSKGCFAKGTMITLADGTQKPIENITYNDKILTWNFFTGKYEEQSIAILVDHGETMYDIANLTFANGTRLNLIAEHGVFDIDENKYIYLTPNNCTEYIGHRFVTLGKNGTYDATELVEAYVTTEITNAYSITSCGNSNAYASGMLTVAPPDDFYNWIEMSGSMQYDVEQFAADVEKYGLYDYAVFADYVTYEQYLAFNGAYLKIAVEKGCFTFERIIELIQLYGAYMPQ